MSTWKRSSTLVFSLLTFWPPAPEERAKDISRDSSGMGIGEGMIHSEFVVEKVRRLGLGRDGGGVWYGV